VLGVLKVLRILRVLRVLTVLTVSMGLSVFVARVEVEVDKGVGTAKVEVDEGVGTVEEGCAGGPTIVAIAEEIGIGAPTNVEGPRAGSVMRPISKVKYKTWKPPVFAQNSALCDIPSFVMV
jgi:hypothetical protein